MTSFFKNRTSGRISGFSKSRNSGQPLWPLIICPLCCLLWFSTLPAQPVQWTSFEDLSDSLRSAPKPLLIFIHTDWCKYCNLQDRNTFGDDRAGRLINEKYYALRLNAESSEEITFLNRTYQGQNNGYHELAELLGKTNGQLTFPTTVILSKDFRLKHRFTGFLEPEAFFKTNLE